MTENEQIQEMMRDLREAEFWNFDDFSCEVTLNERVTCEKLHSKGYRKVERGEWERVGDDIEEDCFRCTVCKAEFSCGVDMRIFAKYCPECGADMRGDNDAEIH